jgi:hypothetical protein
MVTPGSEEGGPSRWPPEEEVRAVGVAPMWGAIGIGVVVMGVGSISRSRVRPRRGAGASRSRRPRRY